MENSMAVPQKMKSRPTIWPSNPTLRRRSKRTEIRISKRYSDLHIIAGLFTIAIAWKIPWTEEPGRLQSMGSQRVGHDWELHFTSLQDMETIYVFIYGWKDKNVVNTMEYYSVFKKKKKILPYVTTWVNLEDIILPEIIQLQMNRYCVTPCTLDIQNDQAHRKKK